MKSILELVLIFFSVAVFSQTTSIPDVNFEQKLINLGHDSGVPDGKVTTANIKSLTSLDVSNYSISDLTGIQAFVSLTTLHCDSNQLTVLDLSQNTALKDLWCHFNQLTALDVSKNTALININCERNKLTLLDLSHNTALTSLYCYINQLTSLNVSKNTLLENLYCQTNQLPSLDVSKNTHLVTLDCFSNKFTALDVSNNTALVTMNCQYNQSLTKLNLKNGNNAILTQMYCLFNPMLTCIEVDNKLYSDANWYSHKSATANYSENCGYLSILGDVFEQVKVYPNPTKDILYINNIVIEKITFYNSLGHLVKTKSFSSGLNYNSIDLSSLAKGIYFAYISVGELTSVKKIIIE